MVELFRFHSTHILLYLKECQICKNFLIYLVLKPYEFLIYTYLIWSFLKYTHWPINFCARVSFNIHSFPQKTVRLRTSFILSSRSWEIGSPHTGGAGRIWAVYVYDSSSQFGGVQSFCSGKRIYLVEEMWWSHLDFVLYSLLFLKFKILNRNKCDHFIYLQLSTLCFYNLVKWRIWGPEFE